MAGRFDQHGMQDNDRGYPQQTRNEQNVRAVTAPEDAVLMLNYCHVIAVQRPCRCLGAMVTVSPNPLMADVAMRRRIDLVYDTDHLNQVLWRSKGVEQRLAECREAALGGRISAENAVRNGHYSSLPVHLRCCRRRAAVDQQP
jgi:hypothetical protein